MKIEREELKNALEIVKPGLANKDLIEQTTSFAFMGNKIVTYNDKISMSHPIKGMEITGAIKAEEIYQLLNRMKAKELDFTLDESELRINAGKAKAGLTLTKEIILPLDEIDEIGEMIPLPKEFLDGLVIAGQASSRDMSRPVLTCIHVNKKILDGTDGYRISRITLKKKLNVEPFLLPAEIIPLIIKMQATKISLTDAWVHFSNEAGTLLSARIFADSFPDTSKFLQMPEDAVEISLPDELDEIIDRASVFSHRDHFSDERIIIQIETGKLRIKGESETGWYNEVAKLKYKGESVTFTIAPFMFKDIIKSIKTCQICTNTGRLKFENDSWQYLAKIL